MAGDLPPPRQHLAGYPPSPETQIPGEVAGTVLPVPGLGPPRQPVPAMGEEGGGVPSWLGAAHHPPAARPTRLRASLELSAPDGEPPVPPAAAPRDAKCAGRAMRAASEQPSDPSSFTKCCRPHRAQRGPPVPRPMRAAGRPPHAPAWASDPAAPPTVGPATPCPLFPHKPTARAAWALGPDQGRAGVGSGGPGSPQWRRQPEEEATSPRTRLGPPAAGTQTPGAGAGALLQRGDGGGRPGPRLGDTQTPFYSLWDAPACRRPARRSLGGRQLRPASE